MNGDFYPGLTVDQVRTAIIVATGLRPGKLGLRLTAAGGGVTVTALRAFLAISGKRFRRRYVTSRWRRRQQITAAGPITPEVIGG